MDMFYDRCRVTQPQQPTNVLIRSLILIASPWQTMRRAIRWKVTEYPMRVEQHLLPRMLTLGFVYSVMIRNYQNFKILSLANRLQEAKRLGLCINCLKVGHQVRQCISSSCRACGSKHHTLLHLGNSPSFPSQEGAQLQEALPSASPSALPSTSTTLIAQEFSNDIALLATATVLVKNRSEVFVPCRALLDSGSQLHLITSRFANQLQVKKIKSSASVT